FNGTSTSDCAATLKGKLNGFKEGDTNKKVTSKIYTNEALAKAQAADKK
ncbi:24533_t:CDS:1, partial [Gigaspora rosea]